MPPEELDVVLELKVLADVGLVGFPNAGKSTLLSVLTSAKPKIADYPFTTLKPNLGIVAYREFKSFIMADIPGIIEGAAEGKGLGHYFLRHIERNSTLLFLVPVDTPNIKDEYDILVNELTKYNPEMLDKERLVVISKCDMLDDELKAELKTQLDKDFAGTPYMFISSVAQQGLSELKDKLWSMLNREDDVPENSHNL
jgi:GTP-binding protein